MNSIRRCCIRAILIINISFPLLLPVGASAQALQDSVVFTDMELLGRPTDRGVTVSACANQALELFAIWGTDSAALANQTPVLNAAKSEPFRLVIGGLEPDTRYYYRLMYRPASGQEYIARPIGSFHTQRAKGKSFSFAVEADPHLDGNAVPALFAQTLENVREGGNDFLIDLGDTFMSEKLTIVTADSVRLRHTYLRSFFDNICHSMPLYLVLGNHEGELGWRHDGTSENLPVWAATARKALFPNPEPDGFYGGNLIPEPFVSLRQNYYSWEWGNALFVVLDPYWYTKTKPGKNTSNWEWTLGRDQYEWFKTTLEQSSARFKFVFCHQLVGGSSEGRGGSEVVDYYEMGGRNADSSWGFDSMRPGWAMPIHQLMVQNHVSAYFHGHDHFYARQEKDGIVYQLVPQPGNKNYERAGQADEYGYFEGTILPASGYLRVTVGDSIATVDYVRSFLPEDETEARQNGMISYTYQIRGWNGGTSNIESNEPLANPAVFNGIYPNPMRGTAVIEYTLSLPQQVRLTIRDVYGRILGVLVDEPKDAGTFNATLDGHALLKMNAAAGLCFAVLETETGRQIRKIMILE